MFHPTFQVLCLLGGYPMYERSLPVHLSSDQKPWEFVVFFFGVDYITQIVLGLE